MDMYGINQILCYYNKKNRQGWNECLKQVLNLFVKCEKMKTLKSYEKNQYRAHFFVIRMAIDYNQIRTFYMFQLVYYILLQLIIN